MSVIEIFRQLFRLQSPGGQSFQPEANSKTRQRAGAKTRLGLAQARWKMASQLAQEMEQINALCLGLQLV